MPRTCGSRPSGPAIVVARSLAIRLLAPDRVPTEVEYSRYTKQADANDYQQKQMPLSQLFFPMISNVPGAILFWDLRLVNVKEHMAVSDIMLGITRDYWDHYNIFFYLLHFFIIEQTRLRQYHLFLLCSACRVIDSITDELMR